MNYVIFLPIFYVNLTIFPITPKYQQTILTHSCHCGNLIYIQCKIRKGTDFSMKCIKKNLGNLAPKYPIEKFCIPKQTLFLDIETTGLYAKSSSLYLIGCIYFDTVQDTWHTIQWFAQTYDEEVTVLHAFITFAKDYRYIIHFNGNHFDIPYLEQKIKQYQLSFSFHNYEGIDIYRRIVPYKAFLKLPNCKQKTIESLLNTNREDTYTGGELIDIYHEYVLSHDLEKEKFLLLHNEEDIKGLLDVIGALAISDLIHEPIKVTKVQANYYTDIDQKQAPELIMNLHFLTVLPTTISYSANGCYFIGEKTEGKLRVPMFEGELKYFYANYKDYYYLPKEDVAIHKSVASFVDKEYREQAHASNCYTKKESTYLPQWDVLFTPFFKKDYKDTDLFFELTDEFKTKREAFNQYAQHILHMMVSYKN